MNKKKVFGAILFSLIIGTHTYAFQLTEVHPPKKVKEVFELVFPKAKKAIWKKEMNSYWKAAFKMRGLKYFAIFLEDGTWQKTGHKIKKNAIPAKVATVLKDQFSGYKIETAKKSQMGEGWVYEFEIKKDDKGLEVIIDNNGQVVEQKRETALNEDN